MGVRVCCLGILILGLGGGWDGHVVPFLGLGEDQVGELVPGAQDAEEFAAVAEDEEELFWGSFVSLSLSLGFQSSFFFR